MKAIAKRLSALLTCVMMFTILFSSCTFIKGKKDENALSDVKDEMYSAEYWTAKYKKSGDVLLKNEDITKLNTSIINGCADMEDIMAYPAALTGTQLTRYLCDWDTDTLLGTVLYNAEGEEVNTPVSYNADGEVEDKGNTKLLDSAIDNTALDTVADNNNVTYALACANTSLRKLPVGEELYASADSDEDVLRIKSIVVGEPMLVLHSSRDLEWVYVQTRETRGWIAGADILHYDKSTWVNYVRADEFVVVTDPTLVLTAKDRNSQPVILYMGTILPISEETVITMNGQSTAGCYRVKIPAYIEGQGSGFSELLIPKTEGINLGWLEYTPENLTSAAFKLMGQKLNPAGVNGGWDADSFYTSVYRCFGIYLPLTIAEQKLMPGTDTDLLIESVDGIKKTFEKLYPGTLLYSDKDAYMYLGKEGNNYYILHPAKEFFTGNTRYTANCIILTDMDIVRADGATYMSSVEKIKKLEITEEK